MGCCGAKSKDEFPRRIPDGAKTVSKTPELVARGSTDTKCCMFFLVCVSLMIGLVAASFYFGEVQRLTHGYDYAGRLCGVDVPEEFVFFCGSKKKDASGNFPLELDFKARTCVAQCPNKTSTQPIQCMRQPTLLFNELNPTTENGITFQKTYQMDVQQTVELGAPYATQELGRYCVPTEENMALRNSVLYGPLRHENAFGKIAASFMHAWPVLLFVVVLASFLGWAFLRLLDAYAGIVIFASMVVATVALALSGLFFFVALFIWDVEDVNNSYNKLNPIVHTSMGNDGRFASVFLGFALMACAACMGLSARTALPEIDKSVGAIRAALDCLFSGGDCCSELIRESLFKTVLILVQLVVCMIGLGIVTSVGYIQHDGISINGQDVQSLQASFTWYWGWWMAIAFYLFMTWWLFEFSLARFQFSISYAVSKWYFVPPTYEDGDLIKVKAQPGPKQVDIRVGGVDTAPGQRTGVRVRTGNGQEVVVAAVGQKGPRAADVIGMMPAEVIYSEGKKEVKAIPACAVFHGAEYGLVYHMGSLALGSIIVSLTRPFRVLATAARALIGKSADRKYTEDTDTSAFGLLKSALNLGVSLVEGALVGVSKNAYCAIVLGSVDFWPAARDAKTLLEDAGGSVAFLHGSTALYELIGIVLISMICGFSSMLMFWYIPCFTDHNNPHWFVEDTQSMVVVSLIVSAIIGYAFMSLFNITLDAMLYTFAWARKMRIADNQKVCPRALKSMIHGAEWEADPDMTGALSGVQGRSQAMAANHVWHSINAMGSQAYQSMRGLPTERNPLLSTAA
eukprot:TRINITY_DN55276_c0_g1_i1.p1 TRINITY_DN55276_c0_g1~~TRINITY_DN55276_c0_g1_i1.p1  ORF type:complete len:820 (+),score=135.01 TRINITY_DN55276_c0_g1_i1:73-2460(+)